MFLGIDNDIWLAIASIVNSLNLLVLWLYVLKRRK